MGSRFRSHIKRGTSADAIVGVGALVVILVLVGSVMAYSMLKKTEPKEKVANEAPEERADPPRKTEEVDKAIAPIEETTPKPVRPTKKTPEAVEPKIDLATLDTKAKILKALESGLISKAQAVKASDINAERKFAQFDREDREEARKMAAPDTARDIRNNEARGLKLTEAQKAEISRMNIEEYYKKISTCRRVVRLSTQNKISDKAMQVVFNHYLSSIKYESVVPSNEQIMKALRRAERGAR